MGAFTRFWKREELLRKTVEIDNSLYEELRELSEMVYHTSINQLINGAIEEMIETRAILLYKKKEGEITEKHSLQIRESLFNGLEELHDQYGTSIQRLINIAIKNAITEEKTSKMPK